MRKQARICTAGLGAAALSFALLPGVHAPAAAERKPKPVSWQVGRPIVTYWAGPPITDAAAQQMADGGWNVIWCSERELDAAQRHGLRAKLQDPLLNPASLDEPARKAALDALIGRVRQHPALYGYFLQDEPGAKNFPALARLIAYLKERDPAHFAYINLFPLYASNDQLGTKGDTVAAYREYLRQFIETVHPALLSYDHYQFGAQGDGPDYFLNLALVRRAALDAGLPFLNIVQACTWAPHMRAPGEDEMRYLVYTTAAYGAQGISYYVYSHPGHTPAVATLTGTPTPVYYWLQRFNREFAAIAGQLQPLRSTGVYHAGMMPPGSEALPPDAPFGLEGLPAALPFKPGERVQGVLLGCFGRARRGDRGEQDTPNAVRASSHVVVVNLDYKKETSVTLTAPGRLETFDPLTGEWTYVGSRRVTLRLPPGGGQLMRLRR